MRIRLIALILAAGAVVLLARTLTGTAANAPQDAVKRLLQPHSVADLCGSLTPAIRGTGPASCVHAFYKRSEVTNLVISHVSIRGTHATLQANYDYPSNPVEADYRLVQRHGVWLIAEEFIRSR